MARSRRKYKKCRPKVRVGLPRKKPGVFKPTFTIPEELLSLAAASADATGEKKNMFWDDKGSYLRNYRTFGVVANPNLLGVRARTTDIVESAELQLPDHDAAPVSEFDPVDSGSDLESEGPVVHVLDFRVSYPNYEASSKMHINLPKVLTQLSFELSLNKYVEDEKVDSNRVVARIIHSTVILCRDLKTALGKKRRDGKAALLQPLTTMQRVHIGNLVMKYGDDYQAMFMDTKLNSMQHSVGTLKKLCQRYNVQRKHYITS